MNVNNNSDFVLKMFLADNEGSTFIPSAYDFKLDFSTSAKHYFATKKSDVLKNCVVGADNSITVYFDNPRFQSGVLKCVFTYYVADENYSDGYRAVTSILDVGINIVDGNGDTYIVYQTEVSAQSVILTDASSVTVNGVSIIPDKGKVVFDGDLSSFAFYGDITFCVFECTYSSGAMVSLSESTSITPLAIKDVLNTLGAVSNGTLNIKATDIAYMDYDDYLIATENGWSVPIMRGSVFIEADGKVMINNANRTPVNHIIFIPNTEIDNIKTTDLNLETGEFSYCYLGRFLKIRQAWCSANFNSLSNIVTFALNNGNIDISGLRTEYSNVINADFYTLCSTEKIPYYLNIDSSVKRCIVSMVNGFGYANIQYLLFEGADFSALDYDLIIDDMPALTNGFYMLASCSRLKSVTLTLPALTNGGYMLSNCSSLQSVTLTLPALTNGENMLQSCRSLQSVTLTLPALTNGGSMLRACSSLQSVTLTLPVLTNGGYMLSSCSSLQSITLTLPALTNGGSMLTDCNSLQSVTLTLPALTNVNIDDVFGYALQYISLTYLKVAVQSYNDVQDIIINSTVLTYLNLGDGDGRVNFNLTIASTVLVSQEAVTDLANSLGAVQGKTLTLSAETKAALNTYNLLSAITAKGWTVAVSE